jgi:hypothetical protein
MSTVSISTYTALHNYIMFVRLRVKTTVNAYIMYLEIYYSHHNVMTEEVMLNMTNVLQWAHCPAWLSGKLDCLTKHT